MIRAALQEKMTGSEKLWEMLPESSRCISQTFSEHPLYAHVALGVGDSAMKDKDDGACYRGASYVGITEGSSHTGQTESANSNLGCLAG